MTNKRQLVDWSSALWAGLVAGVLLWILFVFVAPMIFGGNAWVMVRLIASILMGSEVLAPPAEFHAASLVCALLIHFFMAVGYTLILAVITHRWGLLTGILVGALFDVAVYTIHIFTMTVWYPWFMILKHPYFLFAHVIFGACAGGIYELLEVEESEYFKGN